MKELVVDKTLSKPRQNSQYPLPVPELPKPGPKIPEPEVPNLNSDSDFHYPKLVWVIQVISPGTQTTQIFVYVFCIYHVLLVEHLNLSIY